MDMKISKRTNDIGEIEIRAGARTFVCSTEEEATLVINAIEAGRDLVMQHIGLVKVEE